MKSFTTKLVLWSCCLILAYASVPVSGQSKNATTKRPAVSIQFPAATSGITKGSPSVKTKRVTTNAKAQDPQKATRRIGGMNSGVSKKAGLVFPQVYPSSPPEDPCICVPSYLCVGDAIITDFEVSDAETRHGFGWQCGIKNFVCCRFAPAPTPTPTPPPTTGFPGFTPKCGTLNPKGVNARVLGAPQAIETQFGEYPWMAAILTPKIINGEKSYKFICGGALIWPSVVITAAHCVHGKTGSDLVVRLGEWDTQSVNEFYPHQDIIGDEIVVHPQYYAGGLYYDVALIFLSTSASLAPHIDTICLPEVLPNYENLSCWATGWGKDQFGKAGSYQVILKEVELPIMSKPICEKALRRTNLGSNFNLHSSFLCAGGFKDLDTCVGDGGGGLVCQSTQDPWRYVLAGLVSWGVGCGAQGVPGVYVDVTKVRPWIDLTLSARIPWYDLSRVTIPSDSRRRG